MPSVNFKSIESFSSEDPNHPASNLLKADNRKWKCREAGEAAAFVVIRLDEPVQMSGIDIGNEHSAFVEVLVARSGPSSPTFTEILLSNKFMNPVESRNSTSPNRVQFFSASAMVPSAAHEKWDLVKFICTQPFNARVKYGLTFVALHTATAERKEKHLVPEKFQQEIRKEVERANASNVLNLGRFKLREESPDSDGGEASGGSLSVFARWKEKLKPNTSEVATSVSALMRDSTRAEGGKKHVPKPSSVRSRVAHRPNPVHFEGSDDEPNSQRGNGKPKTSRNHDAILYDEEDEKPNKKLSESIDRHQSKETQEIVRNAPKVESATANKPVKRHDVSSSKFREFLDLTGQTVHREPKKAEAAMLKPSADVKKPHPTHRSPSYESSSSTSDKPLSNARTPLPIERQPVPKKRLSSPTTPVGNKRESSSPSTKKAKVSPTEPKSDGEAEKRVQYKPFGKLLENVVLVISGIQNPDRANIRTQALAMGAKYKPDWDSSCTHLICAYKNTPKYNQVRGKGKIIKKEWIETCYDNRRRFAWRKFAMDTDEANASDSEEEIVDIANKPPQTDVDSPEVEEIPGEAVMLHELSESDPEDGAMPGANKLYDASTEDEADRDGGKSAGKLDFFKDKKFYLDSELGSIDIIKLERFIGSFKGTVSKSMKEVDYVITRRKQTLPAFCSAELVKPLWVYECLEMECLIPIHRYRL